MSQTIGTDAAGKRLVGSKFTMRGQQLLASGMSTDPVAGCDGMWIHAKVYSRGGENALHGHTEETHAFFVLQGSAVFSFGDGSSAQVERFEGVMLPRGALYRFEAQGDENLVMMRIGAAETRPPYFTETFHLAGLGSDSLLDGDGNAMSAQNKGKTSLEPVVPIPNAYFPSNEA